MIIDNMRTRKMRTWFDLFRNLTQYQHFLGWRYTSKKIICKSLEGNIAPIGLLIFCKDYLHHLTSKFLKKSNADV